MDASSSMKGLGQRQDEFGGDLHLLALEPEAEGDLARMEGLHAGGGVDRDLEDLVRRLGRDLLDLHTAFGRGHDGDAAGGAVDQHAEIKLALDVAAFLDIDALHFLAAGAGLVRDERHAEHLAGGLADRLQGFHDLDAARLAAAAGMDLRLDDPDRAAQLGCHLLSLLGGIGDAAARHGHAEPLQESLCLIFMDVHSVEPS